MITDKEKLFKESKECMESITPELTKIINRLKKLDAKMQASIIASTIHTIVFNVIKDPIYQIGVFETVKSVMTNIAGNKITEELLKIEAKEQSKKYIG